MIDATNPQCVRARNKHATASFYYASRRITVVADDGCARCAKEALAELESYDPIDSTPSGIRR